MKMNNPLFGLAMLATAAIAEVPSTVLFQGTISKAGVALTGSHKVSIGICTSNVTGAADCSPIYNSDNVIFSKGYYSVLLGKDIALPSIDRQLYLEVSIDGTTPEDRIALSSAPSALNAKLAEKAALADSTAGGAIRASTAKYADNALIADSTRGGAKRAALAARATLADKATIATSMTGITGAEDVVTVDAYNGLKINADAAYLQLPLNTVAPPNIDCNDASELGRMSLVNEGAQSPVKLYICRYMAGGSGIAWRGSDLP